MAGKVKNLKDLISVDDMGVNVARWWMEWQTLRRPWIAEKEEIRKYLYATDTTTTTNAKLPWKHKTTIPKLTQINDNLSANYMASIFPKRKNSLTWEANDKDSNSVAKRDSVINYMRYVNAHPRHKTEMQKCVYDYIHYGNAFVMPEWLDERQLLDDGQTKVGYVGPVPRRISPLDIVFNPLAPTFREAPKIIRSIVSFGEVKSIIESMSTDENRAEMEELFNYLKTVRTTMQNSSSDYKSEDEYLRVDGFTSFRAYMNSDFVEILTFYGDLYDWKNDKFYKNHQIMVVDRHKVLGKPKPNPSFFGYAPIFHVGWRPRQDNLWAMGPLDNLVGMQYKIDHIENLKADVFDLLIFPPLKITGYVEDFEWAPMERIYVGDNGNVEILAPPFQILQANTEIGYLTAMMEEMAGSPKEAMGFRTPGEKTAYEVQRLENASSRIFNAKIVQFEEQFVEPLYNAELELARRNIDATQTISVFDDEFNIQTFLTLTPKDITGAGKIKPVSARHFAEKAELVQNLNNFANSKLGMDPAIQVHFSSIKTAKLFETLLGIEEFEIVQPYVRLSEQADAQRIQQAAQEQVAMESKTPAGLTPDDHDPDLGGGPPVPGQSTGAQVPQIPTGPPNAQPQS